MKKAIQASAAAALVLGATLAPTALAADKGQVDMYKTAIVFNGKQVSTPMHIVAQDPSTKKPTSYLPLWYIFQALKAVGIAYSWDGRTLNVQPANGINVNLDKLNPGNGPIRLEIDGTLVETAPSITAKDPYSHINSTYLPLYYVKSVLSRLGIQSSWNGSTWNMTMDVVTRLDISGDTTVAQGQPDDLTLTATYASGKTIAIPPGNAKWTSSDNNDGFITPRQQFLATKPGTYTLTAEYGGATQTFQVHVYGTTASIELKPNGSLVANGKSTQTVTVTALDSNGAPVLNENGSVTITASAPSLVTGSQNGNNTLGSSVTVPLKNGVGTFTVQSPTTPGLTLNLTASALTDAGKQTPTYGTASMTSVPQTATALQVVPVHGQQYLIANQSGNTASFDVMVVDQA
ncbi:MAG: bacterial Ig-like domain-containing protein, partial [Alicyclobacillus sp.]|nr:bacterial Ig-like domain-containing protein [Alicyclobacillus sp.]